MTTPAIKDVTEQTRTIVCNQRAYDVANSFVAMREALQAYIDSCADAPHTIDIARELAEQALAMSDGKAVAS